MGFVEAVTTFEDTHGESTLKCVREIVTIGIDKLTEAQKRFGFANREHSAVNLMEQRCT